MKFSAVALATFVAAVSAQGIADIPACAQTCLLPALQATGCSLTDFKCSCSNTEFVAGSTACIQKACSSSDIEKAAKATYELCKSAGVTIVTQPLPGASSTSQAAPSTSAAPEPTTSETEPSTSAAPVPSTSAAPTYGQPESSSKPAEVSTTSVQQSSYGPVPTTTIISTTSAAGNVTTTRPPPPPSTGAAVAVAGNVVLALGGAVAAFFL